MIAVAAAVIIALVAALVWSATRQGGEPSVPPTAVQSSAQSAAQSSSAQSSSATPSPTSTATAPTADDLADALLAVPDGCTVDALKDAEGKVRFSEGTARANAGMYEVSITIDSAYQGSLGGAPTTAARLVCRGGGDTMVEELAFYDPSLALVAALDARKDIGAAAHAALVRPAFTSVEFSADALSLRVSGVSMFGDQASCPTCAPSTEAVVAMRWNGSAFEAVFSWFDTANGAVAAPDQAEAQGFYDAVAAEDYASAARHASQDDIARLRTEGIAGCAPDDLDTCGMRAVQFPVGGQVGACGAIPDVRGSSGEFTIPGDPLGLAFAQSWFTGQPYQQGDFVCGIDTSSSARPLSADGSRYPVWLVVRPTDDPHGFTVVFFGRAFS